MGSGCEGKGSAHAADAVADRRVKKKKRTEFFEVAAQVGRVPQRDLFVLIAILGSRRSERARCSLGVGVARSIGEMSGRRTLTMMVGGLGQLREVETVEGAQ